MKEKKIRAALAKAKRVALTAESNFKKTSLLSVSLKKEAHELKLRYKETRKAFKKIRKEARNANLKEDLARTLMKKAIKALKTIQSRAKKQGKTKSSPRRRAPVKVKAHPIKPLTLPSSSNPVRVANAP